MFLAHDAFEGASSRAWNISQLGVSFDRLFGRFVDGSHPWGGQEKVARFTPTVISSLFPSPPESEPLLLSIHRMTGPNTIGYVTGNSKDDTENIAGACPYVLYI